MYRKKDRSQLEFENFRTPFGGKLRSDNRWVKLARLIPWDDLEEKYSSQFSEQMGAPAKPFRMALGSLIIKERLAISDEETVLSLRENHYLQYFIGLEEYKDEEPFDPSMMVHFRKRLGRDTVAAVNKRIVGDAFMEEGDIHNGDADGPASSDGGVGMDALGDGKGNRGFLMVDASVASTDIRYPTDLSLLNEAREKLEKTIDILHEPFNGKMKKPRTYRKNARRDYLRAAKRRKKTHAMMRKAIRKQLQYVRRDISHVERLLENGSCLDRLSKREYRDLLVIRELFRQQEKMYDEKTHRVDDRIVSISQPYVRPMVRGKDSANVEFGPKLTISRVNGYHILDELSFDGFNEANYLQDQIERYRELTGHYPEAVLADKLYRNRDNLEFCASKNIRLSGPRLGRPLKDTSGDKRQARLDSAMRNAVEGSFGVGKRKYGLDCIMEKLSDTCETTIAIIFLVMNLEKRLRDIFVLFINRPLGFNFKQIILNF